MESEKIGKLKGLIEDSNKILVTSHISPDPDAVCSVILMGSALRLNFPSKEIRLIVEEEPIGLEFITGYKDIEFKNLLSGLKDFKPDLIILLDGNNFDRASRQEGSKVRDFVANNSVKTVIIDHHEPAGQDRVELYINQGSPATAEDVYDVCFRQLNLKQPEGSPQTAMLGLYDDSGAFAYLTRKHAETFRLADELVSRGASIEQAKNDLANYGETDMKIIGELASNVSSQDSYSFSYMRDEFVMELLNDGVKPAELPNGTDVFVNHFLRNIDGRKWGFITYKNTLQGDNYYSVSLRSQGGQPDVSVFAAKLGGGGHKGSAGAKFEAESVQDAVAKIKAAIAST